MGQDVGPGWNDEEPIYNIGAVERMTGIPEATLRVWERRYGFPLPARTVGSHRLYSHSQVRQLRWVKGRVEDGMQIRQAVEALRRLEHNGRPAGSPAFERPAVVLSGRAGPATPPPAGPLVEALLAGNPEAADQVLGEALAVHPIEELVLHMVRPALAEIGRAWEEGRASVATEHFATHFLRHRLLLWMQAGPIPRPMRPVVLACAPGEWHEGSLLILGVLLRRLRWPVAYLGQSLPLADLASFVRQVRPPAVVLVAMGAESATALADWPHWLPDAAAAGRPLVGFGGLIFSEQPEWRERIPGHFLGATLDEAVTALDAWLRSNALPLPGGQVPD